MSNTRTISMSPNGIAPAPFTTLKRPAWVGYDGDDDRYRGFAIFARVTLTNGERRAFQQVAADLDNYREAFLATPEDERGDMEWPIEQQKAFVVPYVLGWNVADDDPDTGESVPVPPPAEAGVIAFEAIDDNLWQWLWDTIIVGHNSGKGLTWRSLLAERRRMGALSSVTAIDPS